MSVNLDESLDADLLEKKAENIILATKESLGCDRVTLKEVVRFFEFTYGPIVAASKTPLSTNLGYLVPVDDADDTAGFLNTAAVPGESRLIPMRINENCFRKAALTQAALKKDLRKIPLHQRETKSEAIAFGDDGDEFEIDTVGDTGILRCDGKFTDGGGEERPTSLERVEITSAKDASKLLMTCAGESIVLESEKVEGEDVLEPIYKGVTIGYSDIVVKPAVLSHIAEKEEGKSNDVIKKTVARDVTSPEKYTLADRKEERALQREARKNVLSDWFGMKRQRITPEIRAEIQAISLRGFASVKHRYRGAKRQLELAKSDSGFFQIGVVKSGGLADSKVHLDTQNILQGTSKSSKRRRKVKSLVRSLLQEVP